jgi:hypothetical protein
VVGEKRGKRFAATLCLLCVILAGTTELWAHEHTETHRRLAVGAFRLLDPSLFQHETDLTIFEIEGHIGQGAVEEDLCLDEDDAGNVWEPHPNWNSHFYEPESKQSPDGQWPVIAPEGCTKDGYVQTTANERAGTLWQRAIDTWKAGNHAGAYRILGHVMHLLGDMTSPAHAHMDPHGQFRAAFSWEDGFEWQCGNDGDDFERWGFCDNMGAFGGQWSEHIRDYIAIPDCEPTEDTGTCEYEQWQDYGASQPCLDENAPPGASPGITCRLWAALNLLYDGQPQGVADSLDEVAIEESEGQREANVGQAFVRRVAQITYDFTTFRAKLQDTTVASDVQPDSELRRMLRGSTAGDCGIGDIDNGLCEILGGGAYHIASASVLPNGFQDIGRTAGQCGRTELGADWLEEWWLMEGGCTKIVTRDTFCGPFRCRPIPGPQALNNFLDGFAYIENTGGEGPNTLGEPYRFIPLRYGCNPGDGGPCADPSDGAGARSKVLFRKLYGTNVNMEDDLLPCPGSLLFMEPCPEPGRPKTMLRIYGDVLYTTAVAYGAGLIEKFVEATLEPPIAVAGGPYAGEACQPVSFDASGSSGQSGRTIVAYDWDFTADGVVDQTTPVPYAQHAYPQPFEGELIVRVLDSDGLTGDDRAAVHVAADTTPPSMDNMTADPNVLRPPYHRMKRVTIDPKAADACGMALCDIAAVTSNAPPNGGGPPDVEVTGDLTLNLRAETSAQEGNNRLYSITVQCRDVSGNSSLDSVGVSVPRPQRRQR